eukprot:3530086-Prorocentrum_lima.AAC.1
MCIRDSPQDALTAILTTTLALKHKPNGSLRPIDTNTIYRRLAAKVLVSHHKQHITTAVHPHQYG